MSRRHKSPPPTAAGDDHDDDQLTPPGKVRLDKWLWFARFFKTRALAGEAIDGGKLEVNGEKAKRAKLVQMNDQIRLRNGPYEWHLVVRDIAQRRGSAQVAQQLYEETAESKAQRETVTAHLKSMPTAFAYNEGKPGKRDRRELRRLKGDR
jgi:ribosome-associated heat shock protein Hsp15